MTKWSRQPELHRPTIDTRVDMALRLEKGKETKNEQKILLPDGESNSDLSRSHSTIAGLMTRLHTNRYTIKNLLLIDREIHTKIYH